MIFDILVLSINITEAAAFGEGDNENEVNPPTLSYSVYSQALF